MPNGKRRRRRRRRRGASVPYGSWFDWYGGVVESGGSAVYKYNGIEGLSDKDRPFQILSAQATMCTTSPAGACCQLDIYDDTNVQAVCTTGPVLIGQIPRRVTLRVPSPKWWHVSQNDELKICALQSITQSKTDKAQFRFVCRIHFRVGAELFRGISARLATPCTFGLEHSFEDLELEDEYPPSPASPHQQPACSSRRRMEARLLHLPTRSATDVAPPTTALNAQSVLCDCPHRLTPCE